MKLKCLLLIVIVFATFTVQSQRLTIFPNPDSIGKGYDNAGWQIVFNRSYITRKHQPTDITLCGYVYPVGSMYSE